MVLLRLLLCRVFPPKTSRVSIKSKSWQTHPCHWRQSFVPKLQPLSNSLLPSMRHCWPVRKAPTVVYCVVPLISDPWCRRAARLCHQKTLLCFIMCGARLSYYLLHWEGNIKACISCLTIFAIVWTKILKYHDDGVWRDARLAAETSWRQCCFCRWKFSSSFMVFNIGLGIEGYLSHWIWGNFWIKRQNWILT